MHSTFCFVLDLYKTSPLQFEVCRTALSSFILVSFWRPLHSFLLSSTKKKFICIIISWPILSIYPPVHLFLSPACYPSLVILSISFLLIFFPSVLLSFHEVNKFFFSIYIFFFQWCSLFHSYLLCNHHHPCLLVCIFHYSSFFSELLLFSYVSPVP